MSWSGGCGEEELKKKGMYELFPFLWPFICYFSLNLSVLEVFGRFLCAVNDGLRLACCLRNGIANTGPWVELAKRQNGPKFFINYLYTISGHKVATLGGKKKLFFATNKILGKKAFVHCIRTRKGGALACTCPIQCRLRLMFGNSSSMTLLPSRQTVLHHGALVLGWCLRPHN